MLEEKKQTGSLRIDRRQLAEDALLQLLQEPDYEPGARLPTERALAERLRLPRSAVRAAFSRLEAHGRVVRVMGSGTFVAETEAKPVTTPSPGGQDASPQEIMETRLLVEPKLAGHVVAHANTADIDTIADAMKRAEDAENFAEFEVWDARFHQAIAEATHNRLMIEIYRTLSAARELAEWGELKRRSITNDRRASYQEEHREILASFRARDTDRAEAALRAHLVNVRKNLLGY